MADPFQQRISAQLPPRRSPFPIQGRREIIPTPAASKVGRMLSPQHRALESYIRSQAHRRAPNPTSARNRAAAGPRALQSAISGLLGGLRPPAPSQSPVTPTPGAPAAAMTPNGPATQPLMYQPNMQGAPTPLPPQQGAAPSFQLLPFMLTPTGVPSPYQAQGPRGLASAGPVRGMTIY